MQTLSDPQREEIIQLICRKMSGLIDGQELLRLQELEKTFGLEEIYPSSIVQRLRQKPEFDYTEPLQEFKNGKGKKNRHIKPPYAGWRTRVAVAAILVMAIGIGLLWRTSTEPTDNTPLSTNHIISPGKSVATITLANGKQLELGKNAASLCEKNGTLLKLDSTTVTYQGAPAPSREIVYNTISIPIGGEYMLILADGTKVWMNADSKLKYPVSFSRERREVYLKGEAYFEVAKDSRRPFIVHTSRGAVEVLGTGFNVRDYREEQKVVTTLVQGRVVYRSEKRPEQEIVLEPGFQVKDEEGGTLQSRKVDVVLYTGWKDGKYVFENATLEEIMQVLSKWYDIAVFYKREEVKNLHFTGDLERYETINDFLEFMEIGGNVRFNIKGKTIMIE